MIRIHEHALKVLSACLSALDFPFPCFPWVLNFVSPCFFLAVPGLTLDVEREQTFNPCFRLRHCENSLDL